MTPGERSLAAIDYIAFWHGVDRHAVMSGSSTRKVTAARIDAAVYFRARGRTYKEIGITLGRDHSSIIIGVEKLERRQRI